MKAYLKDLGINVVIVMLLSAFVAIHLYPESTVQTIQAFYSDTQ